MSSSKLEVRSGSQFNIEAVVRRRRRRGTDATTDVRKCFTVMNAVDIPQGLEGRPAVG